MSTTEEDYSSSRSPGILVLQLHNNGHHTIDAGDAAAAGGATEADGGPGKTDARREGAHQKQHQEQMEILQQDIQQQVEAHKLESDTLVARLTAVYFKQR